MIYFETNKFNVALIWSAITRSELAERTQQVLLDSITTIDIEHSLTE